MIMISSAAVLAPAGAEPTRDDRLLFAHDVAPDLFDHADNAGETSIAFDAEAGAALFLMRTSLARVTWDGDQAAWASVPGTTTSVATLDPILWADPATGRSFVAQLIGAGSILEFTDDAGETWTQTTLPTVAPSWDHQTVGGGPYSATLAPPKLPGAYPHAVYYCAQGSVLNQCARSDDGGLTWGAPIVVDVANCSSLHGHVTVGPDGVVYLPLKRCGARSGLAVSHDNGLTWRTVSIVGTTAMEYDPAIAVDQSGRAYYFGSESGRPVVATSIDGGLTWGAPTSVAGGHAIANSGFHMAVAGDAGRAAVAYYGTPTPGDDQARTFLGAWHLFVAITTDGGASWTVRDTTPGDPVQRGAICMQGISCAAGRNLLDFQGMTIDDEGRVLVGYADGCVSARCVSTWGGITDSDASRGVIARQVGGPRLRAAFDPVAGPLAAEIIGEDVATSGKPTRLVADAYGGVPPYSVAWDLDGDGAYDDATGAGADATISLATTIGARVTDAAGSVVLAYHEMSVGPVPGPESLLWSEGFDAAGCSDALGWTVDSASADGWRLVAGGENGTACSWYHAQSADAGYPAGDAAATSLTSPASACFAVPEGNFARFEIRVAGEVDSSDALLIEASPCDTSEWAVAGMAVGALGDQSAAPTSFESVSADVTSVASGGAFRVRLRIDPQHVNHIGCHPVDSICRGYHIDSFGLYAAEGFLPPPPPGNFNVVIVGPTAALVDTTIHFDAHAGGGSEPYAFAWDLDEDGAFDDATGGGVELHVTSVGTHVVHVRATDALGAMTNGSATVEVSAMQVLGEWTFGAGGCDAEGWTKTEPIASPHPAAAVAEWRLLESVAGATCAWTTHTEAFVYTQAVAPGVRLELISPDGSGCLSIPASASSARLELTVLEAIDGGMLKVEARPCGGGTHALIGGLAPTPGRYEVDLSELAGDAPFQLVLAFESGGTSGNLGGRWMALDDVVVLAMLGAPS